VRLTRAEREFMGLAEPGYGLPRCVNCGKPMRWCELYEKWFHVGNLTTFCTDAWGKTIAEIEIRSVS